MSKLEKDVKQEKVPLFHRLIVLLMLYMIFIIVILVSVLSMAPLIGISLPNPSITTFSIILINGMFVLLGTTALSIAIHIGMHKWLIIAIRIIQGKERIP